MEIGLLPLECHPHLVHELVLLEPVFSLERGHFRPFGGFASQDELGVQVERELLSLSIEISILKLSHSKGMNE